MIKAKKVIQPPGDSFVPAFCLIQTKLAGVVALGEIHERVMMTEM